MPRSSIGTVELTNAPIVSTVTGTITTIEKGTDSFAHEGGHLMGIPDLPGDVDDIMDHGPSR